MQNLTQFQTTPGFGNFTPNMATTTQGHWGETTGYGYQFGSTIPYGTYGIGSTQPHSTYHPLVQAIGNTLGFGHPSFGTPSTNQEILSTVSQAQNLFQSLFSENGLVLGPINGGADSFFGNASETSSSGAIGRFLNLVQGVSSAQAIAFTGITGGQNTLGTGIGHGFGAGTGQSFGTGFGAGAGLGQAQGFGISPLTFLMHVRYFDNNSTFVIESAIVGGNTKNLNVTVVGDEIRIQRTDTASTSTSKNLVTQAAQGNTSTYYSLPLPNSADSKGITATAKDGILTITLPKTQEISKKVRQITVK